MKETWYDLVYEESEKGKSYCGPTVLYTSPQGLKALASELQKLAQSNHIGRSQLQIEEMDHDYYAPFTHIEIANQPLAQEDRKKTKKDYLWVGGVLVALPLLAIYGAIRLLMDILG